MTLNFEQLQSQIKAMGVALAERGESVAEQASQARDLLRRLNDLNAIWQKIMIAREQDAGFRGAAPYDEPINQPIARPETPPRATILAADGSQIYPDIHGPVPYWLTNIGVFIYHHGTDALPALLIEPRLFYDDEDVRDSDGRLVANSAINARRSVYEMQTLARVTSEIGEAESVARPLLALYDGPLLGVPMGKDVPDANRLKNDYHEGFDFVLDAGGGLAGYVDRPTSRFVIYMLYLMTLEPEEITRVNLTSGAVSLEGLNDADLYKHILGPGDRTGIMVQQSPLNKEYTEHDPLHEIAFFYLNTAAAGQEPYLARVEVPIWVARDKGLVGAIHALIYDQCQITDRYPYALTRADEIAVVHPAEKRELDEMIAIELLANRQQLEMSQKLSSKNLARRGRQHYEGVR